MRETKAPFRVYREADHPFGPPPDSRYAMDAEGRPILLARDTRMWVSEEELRRLLALRLESEAVDSD